MECVGVWSEGVWWVWGGAYISERSPHFPTQIPILKLGVRRSFQVHTTVNTRFNCFRLQTSSRVRLTQLSLKRVGQ